MAKKEKRAAWSVLGRKIGSAIGWDHAGTFCIQLYDFEPASGVDLPSGVLCINFENGLAETYDDEGRVLTSHDIITALNNSERS